MKNKKNNYRICPYCGRYVPYPYNFSDHKKICKNVDNAIRVKSK